MSSTTAYTIQPSLDRLETTICCSFYGIKSFLLLLLRSLDMRVYIYVRIIIVVIRRVDYSMMLGAMHFFFFVFSSSSSSCGWLKCEKLWESAFLFSTPSDNPFSHSHYPFWNLASALSERNKTITSTTQYRSHFSPLSLSLLSITIDFSPCRSTVTNVAINESNDDDDDASCTWHW